MLTLTLCLLACVGLRVQGGVAQDLSRSQEQVVADLGFDMTMGPSTSSKVFGTFSVRHIDTAAPCHYELHLGVRGHYAQDRAMTGPAVGMLGHCHVFGALAAQGTAGVKVFELGAQDGAFTAGVTSPYAQLGLRLTLSEGVYLGVEGLGGYDLRPGRHSYPYVGGMARFTVGILP